MNCKAWFKSLFKKEEKQAEKQPETRIEYLVRELIKELQIDGKDINLPNIAKGYASFDVTIRNLNQPNEEIYIQNIINHWEIKFER